MVAAVQLASNFVTNGYDWDGTITTTSATTSGLFTHTPLAVNDSYSVVTAWPAAPESPLAWLDRRIEEMRVRLTEEGV